MKPYKFLKFTKTLIKRQNTLTHKSMRKKKLRKAGVYFITAGFINPFIMIINDIFFSQTHLQRLFFFFFFLVFDIRLR